MIAVPESSALSMRAITSHLSPITNHFSQREPKASAVAEDQISF